MGLHKFDQPLTQLQDRRSDRLRHVRDPAVVGAGQNEIGDEIEISAVVDGLFEADREMGIGIVDRLEDGGAELVDKHHRFGRVGWIRMD